MNDLITSVAKERMLPVSADFIDYPNAQFENQLHRLSIYFTKFILDAFVLVTHWSLCNLATCKKGDSTFLSEKIRLSLALKSLFPLEWLQIAEQSPTFHLKLHRVIERYRFTLSEASVKRIHKIVEFLCFEIIESTVIRADLKPMYKLTIGDMQHAIELDPILKQIFYRHNVFLVTHFPSHEKIQFDETTFQMSLKASRYLRIYIEEMIREVIRQRENEGEVTLHDVEHYFKMNTSVQ